MNRTIIIAIIVALGIAVLFGFGAKWFLSSNSDYDNQHVVQDDEDTQEAKGIYSDDKANIGPSDAYLDDDKNFGQGDSPTIISGSSESENPEVASHEGDAHLVQETETYKDFLSAQNMKGFKVLYTDYSETNTDRTYTYAFENTDLIFEVTVSNEDDSIKISDVHNSYTQDQRVVVFKNATNIDKEDFYTNVILDRDIRYYAVKKKNKIVLYNYDSKKQKLMTYNTKSHVTEYHY